jgi:molybdopterin converting factor small subunit
MKVRLQYTAQLRAAVGRVEEDVEPIGDGNLGELLIRLATEWRRAAAPFVLTAAGDLQPSLLIGVNGQGVSPREARTTKLRDGDVVTLMPPIAGG